MLTWDRYRANHPDVLASWAQQNGRQPTCTCPRCKPHHDGAAQALVPEPTFGERVAANRAAMYRDAVASSLAAGRGVALHVVLGQMRVDGYAEQADDVEETLARAAAAAARKDPAVMAELLDLVRRAYPETAAGAVGGTPP